MFVVVAEETELFDIFRLLLCYYMQLAGSLILFPAV